MKTLILLFLSVLFGGCATYQHTHAESTDKEEITFAILGYVSEYISRYNYHTGKPHENLVESFYPHEKNEADRFEELLIQYHQIMNMPYMVKRKLGSQGHISFHDNWMSEQINQHYYNPDKRHKTLYTINPDFILNGKKESLMAYIESRWDRDGNDERKNVLYFANEHDLTQTAAKALISLGSEWVVIYLSCPDMIPSCSWLHFDVPPCLEDLGLNETKDGSICDPDFREWKRYEKGKLNQSVEPTRITPRDPVNS